MKVLNNDRAFIPIEKIRDYLLSNLHPVGSSNSNSRRNDLFDQVGSRRNHQNIEGFATNRQPNRRNVLAFLILMTIWLAISTIKVKMRIALLVEQKMHFLIK